ncbi:MAG: hypothetical protein ACI38U_02220 [Corynebacterium sp.]|uniref:hypothetical protein n=1 Tax=Corynebacterium sp. TaxID=1720 RepID=UPI003F0F1D6D
MYGDPRARIRIVRRYPSVIKAKLYLGENRWSEVHDVHPGDVLDDGGAAWGWEPPAT